MQYNYKNKDKLIAGISHKRLSSGRSEKCCCNILAMYRRIDQHLSVSCSGEVMKGWNVPKHQSLHHQEVETPTSMFHIVRMLLVFLQQQ